MNKHIIPKDKSIEFVEDDEGVHIMNPNDEGTLCGTFPGNEPPYMPTRKRTVTCRQCARTIHALQGLKYSMHEDDIASLQRKAERK